MTMTETECYECDYSENCDWELILANSRPFTSPCEAKQWHDKSRETFFNMTMSLRKKLEGGGEEVVRGEWGDYKHEPARTKVSIPVGWKGIDQTDEGWT